VITAFTSCPKQPNDATVMSGNNFRRTMKLILSETSNYSETVLYDRGEDARNRLCLCPMTPLKFYIRLNAAPPGYKTGNLRKNPNIYIKADQFKLRVQCNDACFTVGLCYRDHNYIHCNSYDIGKTLIFPRLRHIPETCRQAFQPNQIIF